MHVLCTMAGREGTSKFQICCFQSALLQRKSFPELNFSKLPKLQFPNLFLILQSSKIEAINYTVPKQQFTHVQMSSMPPAATLSFQCVPTTKKLHGKHTTSDKLLLTAACVSGRASATTLGTVERYNGR